MKKFIFFILFALALTSCYKTQESGIKSTKEVILDRSYTPSHTSYGYHYGYSIMYGKFCYHYGSETDPAKCIVSYSFLEDTITWNDYYLLSHTNDFENIKVYYTEIYHVTKDKKEFIRYSIKWIVTSDTTLRYNTY